MENERWIKKFRLFTIGLIFSGALNVGLLTALVVLLIDDQKYVVSGFLPQKGEQQEITNGKLAGQYTNRSFRELVALLQEKELVEDGFRKCDLALGTLVSFHDFNLEKALGGVALQRRIVKNPSSEEGDLQLFPGLTEEQFLAIIRFAHFERWPFTARGLFAFLKKNSQDPTLTQAFFLTSQFKAIQTLFPKVSPEVLIDFVRQGEWEVLDQFAKEQSLVFDLSEERRREFLSRYPPHELLLQIDFSYVLKKFDDEALIAFLEKSSHSDLLRDFCLVLLQSLRSDAVRQKSAETLYRLAQEPMPVPFNYATALARFLPQEEAAQIEQVKDTRLPEPKEHLPVKIHVVKEGENLWKIARFYGVKVEELIALNKLEGATLRVGTNLKVPGRLLRDGRDGSATRAGR